MASSTDPQFQSWLQRVDQEMWDQFGCSYQDLPDWDFWAAYEAGMSPSKAAKQVAKNAESY